jgi:muconolactone D-isomerase
VEFLIEIEVRLPSSMDDAQRARLIEEERVRGRQLAEQGVIRAIWRVPGRFANRAIWSAPNATDLHNAIASLPLWPYIDAVVTPLADHDLGQHCQGLKPGLGA